MKQKIFYTILFLTIFSGFLLRFYNLDKQSYWMDEGYTINAVLSVLEKGNTILDSGQNYFCPMYCYPTAWVAQIFGSNATSFRILSVIFGIFLIFAVYFIVRKLFNKNSALLATFFVSFSYWQIAWSRQARWYTMLTLFFWLAIYFFYQFLQEQNNRKKIIYFISSLVITFLAVLTHRVAYFLIPIFITILALDLLKNREKINKKGVFLTFFSLILATFLLETIFNFGITNTLLAKFSLYYELPYYLSFFLVNYWFFIILSLYAYFGASEDEKMKYGLFLVPFLVYLVLFSFFTNIVHYRYLFAPALGFLILGAVGAMDIFEKLWQKNKIISWGFLGIIVIAFFISGQGVWKPLPFYILENDNITTGKTDRPYFGYTPQPNFNGAYEVIAQNLKPNEIVISSHPHFNKIFLQQPGYWLRYNYLGFEKKVDQVMNGKEYYVGAKVINSLEELKQIASSTHGYVVFDYMSATGRIPPEIVYFIRNSFEQIYFDEINAYSKIWVYKF